jgi:predicted thioesterase
MNVGRVFTPGNSAKIKMKVRSIKGNEHEFELEISNHGRLWQEIFIDV